MWTNAFSRRPISKIGRTSELQIKGSKALPPFHFPPEIGKGGRYISFLNIRFDSNLYSCGRSKNDKNISVDAFFLCNKRNSRLMEENFNLWM